MNAGTLLERHKVFKETYFSKNLDKEVDINSYLAYNFFKMALNHLDTRDEAIMKLADYYNYGLPPVNKPHIEKAAKLCRFIELYSKDSELRGQALTYLGLIYHFGDQS